MVCIYSASSTNDCNLQRMPITHQGYLVTKLYVPDA